MLKLITLSLIICNTISLPGFLTISCQGNKNDILYERLMIISEVRAIFGLVDTKDNLPKMQPFFDQNNKLVTSENSSFNDEQFLSKTFLDSKKHAKNDFSFKFLTTFLKLIPNADDTFDLSNIILKVNNINYLKISTKIDANKKNLVFTNGVINFIFENKDSNEKIESFNAPVKDLEVDFLDEMFNDKFETQDLKDEKYNDFFNIDRDFNVIGFQIGQTINNVTVKLQKYSALMAKLQIFNNFNNLKLDNLVKFNISLNREKSKVSDSEDLTTRAFKDGDFLDIEFTLSVPNGDVSQSKLTKTLPTTDFSINLIKGPL